MVVPRFTTRGGGILEYWYFHTYIGSGHILGFKILNFNIFWGFQKNNFLGGMKTLWIFFLGLHKIGLYLGVISMHFRVFSECQGTEWGIFFWLLKFKIFFGRCLKFLIFLGE